jgi:hypothetical protein
MRNPNLKSQVKVRVRAAHAVAVAAILR